MAGVKGKSGRKSGPQEKYRLETIEECWKLVREAINNKNLDYEYRVELASRHTVKSIPTELAGGFSAQVTQMPSIQKEYATPEGPTNRIVEFDIGSSDSPEIT